MTLQSSEICEKFFYRHAYMIIINKRPYKVNTIHNIIIQRNSVYVSTRTSTIFIVLQLQKKKKIEKNTIRVH